MFRLIDDCPVCYAWIEPYAQDDMFISYECNFCSEITGKQEVWHRFTWDLAERE